MVEALDGHVLDRELAVVAKRCQAQFSGVGVHERREIQPGDVHFMILRDVDHRRGVPQACRCFQAVAPFAFELAGVGDAEGVRFQVGWRGYGAPRRAVLALDQRALEFEPGFLLEQDGADVAFVGEHGGVASRPAAGFEGGHALFIACAYLRLGQARRVPFDGLG